MEKMVKQPLLQKAMEFAAMKHAEYVRKGTTIPYLTHVMEAMEIVSRMTEDEEVRAAAVLHDTLEDTFTTKDELVHVFGQRVADLVAAESEDKREDQPAEETWLIRKQETIKHLSKASTEIRMLALGDKLSNVRAMTHDYARIGEDLWKKFNNSDPTEQGMYYGLLANVFWEDEFIRTTPEYKEYVTLCADIFGKERDGDGNLIVEDRDADQQEEEYEDQEGGFRSLCCIYDMDDAHAVDQSFREVTVKEYGDSVCLSDGTKLHDNLDGEYGNYTAPVGRRELVRCRKCGALLIHQHTCDPNIYDGFEFLDDWIPVASVQEADLLNILLSGQEFTAYSFRHFRQVNLHGRWSEGKEPCPNDPDDLIQMIMDKYTGVDPALLAELIRETGAES